MPSGQATNTNQSGTYPTGSPQSSHHGPPGPDVPSDSNPMTYQAMLDSLPSSGNAAGQGSAPNTGQGSAYTPVQYPNIEAGGPGGQGPNLPPGAGPTSMGAQPGTG